jgi:hypothetical protein
VPQAIFLTTQGCHQIPLSPKGCREPKKVEKHCPKRWFDSNVAIAFKIVFKKQHATFFKLSSSVDVCTIAQFINP